MQEESLSIVRQIQHGVYCALQPVYVDQQTTSFLAAVGAWKHPAFRILPPHALFMMGKITHRPFFRRCMEEGSLSMHEYEHIFHSICTHYLLQSSDTRIQLLSMFLDYGVNVNSLVYNQSILQKIVMIPVDILFEQEQYKPFAQLVAFLLQHGMRFNG
jgi:hypothetical protein